MIRLTENGKAGMNPEATQEIFADCQWRLETLGMVTEGVAHDFNNILATITGFAELILDSGDRSEGERSKVSEFARNILQAATVGHSTVRELRGFVRQSTDEKELLDLHEVLRQSLSMTRGALGGTIAFSSEFAEGKANVQGCRWQLHNVFINLLFNARDAMPKGGRIWIQTTFLEGVAGLPDFLVVSIRDNGMGMSGETRARLFETKFTTKGGSGSGMGLLNVAATVKSHGGMITVESAPGKGSEFRLHFPLANTARD